MPNTSRRHLAVAPLAVLATLTLAGCGVSSSSTVGDSGATSAGVTYASEQIEAASVDPTFEFDGAPFPMGDISGKKIFNIPNTSAIPYIVAVDELGKELAERYGASWTEYTNQGTPNEWSTGVDQAISQDADVIVLSQGNNPELIIPALQRAKAAGIPVVVSHTYQDGEGIPEKVEDLVAAQISAPFNESGRLTADWAIKETEGKGHILLVNSSEVPPSEGIIAAQQDEFARHCPECKVKVVNVPVADWATKIATTVQSEIQADPELDYVLPVYDSMMIYVESGVKAAAKTGSVFTASFNGTPAVLKLMQEGQVVTMDVGESLSWLAHATMDQVGRVLTGTPIVEDGNEHTPLKVITKETVDQTGTPPVADKGYGDAYVAGYEAIWGGPE